MSIHRCLDTNSLRQRPTGAMPFYKVTYAKRFDSEGEEADRPETFVEVSDGVVLSAAKAEQTEPPGMHNKDVMDEDDAFLAVGTEVWEYEIADGTDEEFIQALERSQKVIQYEQMDEVI